MRVDDNRVGYSTTIASSRALPAAPLFCHISRIPVKFHTPHHLFLTCYVFFSLLGRYTPACYHRRWYQFGGTWCTSTFCLPLLVSPTIKFYDSTNAIYPLEFCTEMPGLSLAFSSCRLFSLSVTVFSLLVDHPAATSQSVPLFPWLAKMEATYYFFSISKNLPLITSFVSLLPSLISIFIPVCFDAHSVDMSCPHLLCSLS